MKAEDLNPVFPNILVRRLPPDTGYAHLKIVLPEAQDIKNRKCEVINTYPNSRVQPGDIVELVVFDGIEVSRSAGPDLEFCDEDNILCVVRDGEFVPLGNRVIVKPHSRDSSTPGKIILPDNRMDSKPCVGVITSIGPEVKEPLQIGDRVGFDPYSGVKLTKAGEEFLIMPEEMILMTMDEIVAVVTSS